jgi:bacterioferritin-associated ferredoxin
MYICVCHAVTNSAINQAVNNGAASFRDLSFATGCGTQCGSCITQARQVMDEALSEQGLAQAQVKLQVVSSA